jgi:SprT protein
VIEDLTLKANELFQSYYSRLSSILSPRQLRALTTTEININRRMRSTLGRAYISENRIELNARLLEKHPEELAPTLAHELAHLVAPMMYGRQGLQHREGWQKVITYLGFEASRTHSLDVAALKNRHQVKAWAVCGCPERKHPIYARRLQKMRRRYRYICVKCRKELSII